VFELLDVDLIMPAPWNYKTNDAGKQKELVERIKERGQLATIIVRKLKNGHYESCDGSHRVSAFKELGIKKVMVYNLGEIDQSLAEKIGYEMNELRFDADPMKLDSLLNRIGIKKTEVPKPKPIDIAPKPATVPDIKPIILDPGPKPHGEDARPSKAPIGNKQPDVQHYETDKTVIQLRLSVDVAAQFKEQLDRVKIAMFKGEKIKDVADTLPIQAICQVLSEVSVDRFSKKS
jgi:hypothetical protein